MSISSIREAARLSLVTARWTTGLFDEFETEIRKGLHSARRKGKEDWGDSRKKRIKHDYVVKPLFPTMAKDDESEGRSRAYHEEMVKEKIARHEAGKSLWNDDMADLETFEGTELRDSERSFIGTILDMRDAHLPKKNQPEVIDASEVFYRPREKEYPVLCG